MKEGSACSSSFLINEYAGSELLELADADQPFSSDAP